MVSLRPHLYYFQERGGMGVVEKIKNMLRLSGIEP
jgi:hypothetical protein